MPLIPPNQDRDDVIRAVAELLDCSYIDEVPTAAENDRLREVAVTAREALDRIVARALAAEADAARLRAHIDAAGDGANLPALLDLYHDRAERAFADAARWRKVAPLIGALGAPDEHAAHTATWLALTSAITSALAAAREAGRREVLEGAAGVEEAIADVVFAATSGKQVMDDLVALRAAIAADKARAVEAERVRLWHAVLSDLRNVAGVDAAEGKPPVSEFNALLDGLRPVLSQADAERLVGDFNASPYDGSDDCPARAALLAALTGAGGGS